MSGNVEPHRGFGELLMLVSVWPFIPWPCSTTHPTIRVLCRSRCCDDSGRVRCL